MGFVCKTGGEIIQLGNMDKQPWEKNEENEQKFSWRKLKTNSKILVVGVLLMMGILLLAWVALRILSYVV